MYEPASPDQAARALLDRLPIPRRAVAVRIVSEHGITFLVVLVDRGLLYRRDEIPRRFRGYPVRVEEREVGRALN